MLKITRLRKDLEFNKLMTGIIEVLKGVASAEYFRLQAKRKTFDEFELHLKDIFQIIELGDFKHPFLDSASSVKNIVLITSDAGFLGRLNISVVSQALNQENQNDIFTVVGTQGARYLKEHGKAFHEFPGIDDEISYEKVIGLRDFIVRSFFEKRLGGTTIIYPHFVSFALQKTQTFQLLPCKFLFPQESTIKLQPQTSAGDDFWRLSLKEELIIEPSLKQVVEYVVKAWIGQLIYLIFWESKLSEWAARVMHLEKSSTAIKNQDRKLRLQYFRLFHQLSDNNTREIFASRLALEQAKIHS